MLMWIMETVTEFNYVVPVAKESGPLQESILTEWVGEADQGKVFEIIVREVKNERN
jgi:hypothetical protein